MTLRYVELKDNSRESPDSVLTAMLRTQHSCNPDFAGEYSRITNWHIEIDDQTWAVLREIGLDEFGEPVVPGPFGRNDGLWTVLSASMIIDCDDLPRVERSEFELAWAKLDTRYRDRVPPKLHQPWLPVTSAEQLVASWSGGDQVITFLPSGKGFFEDYNVALMYYDEFHWEIIEQGRIRIRGVADFYQDDDSNTVREPGSFEYENLVAEIQTHHSESGDSNEVLHLPLKNERRMWVSEVYGRCPRKNAASYRPRFD